MSEAAHTPGPWRRGKECQHADRTCRECGQTFRPLKQSSAYCSVPCARKKNGGHNKKAESWWVNSRGYIEGRIWTPEGENRRVKQHRYVLEQALGRRLKPTETVHHINGDKVDNRLENLRLMDHGAHTRLHNRSRKYARGYKLDLSREERARRSKRLKRLRRLGVVMPPAEAAIAKAKGERS